MPTISVWIVKKPRIRRLCDHYRCNNVLRPGDPVARLYGSACNGDPCYSSYLCLECAKGSEDPKIIEALNKAGAEPDYIKDLPF